MKSGKLFLLALLSPALLCGAQEKEPSGKPAEAAPPAAAAPAAPAAQAAAAAPATQTAAPAAGTAADTYVIGPSDTLAVTVWKDSTLSGGLLVRPDGMISMPLLGDIQASGLTPLQLADQIAGKLTKFMQDPKVTVVVTAIRSKVVYLLGEVGKKGPIEMTPDMTLLQAIGSAGGLSEFANVKKIYILRDEAGKRLRIPVQYKEALKGNSEFDLALKPGDTIVVP